MIINKNTFERRSKQNFKTNVSSFKDHIYNVDCIRYSATARTEIPLEFFHVSTKRIANSTIIEPSGGNNLYN